MPSFSGGPDFRTPFGVNQFLRSTRDVKTESRTLARSTVTAQTIDGFSGQRVIQKGTVLALITSGTDIGKVGPYQPAEGNISTTPVYTLSTSGVPTGGTFVLDVNGLQTAAIAFNATAATVQAALEALPNFGGDAAGVNVVATGGALPSAITLTFQAAGRFGGTNPVPTVAVDVNSLTGGTNPAASVVLTDPTAVQTITVTGTPTGGTFELEFGGYTTTPIAFNATAAAVQAALEALPNFGNDATGVNIVATGGAFPGTPVVVTFQRNGRFGQGAVPAIALVNNALTGGATPSVSVAQTTPGGGVAGATDGRGNPANIVGLCNTFLPWTLDVRDVEVAVVYEASVYQAFCIMYDPNGNPIPVDNATATAMSRRSSKSTAILFH